MTSTTASTGERTAASTRDGTFLAACALLFLACAWVSARACGSMAGGMRMPGGWTMSMAWMRMSGQTWIGAGASFLAMWTVMMAAMMLPSLVPMLADFRGAIRNRVGTRLDGLTALAGAGYLLVWALFGAVVFPLGALLSNAAMRSPAFSRTFPLAAGIALLLAGMVQMTGWKARQLGRCRNAASHGRPPSADARGAWAHGLGLGVRCSLCSASFVVILIVLGVMDLRAMAAVTAAITLERVGPVSPWIARAIGLAVIAAGLVAIVRGARVL